MTTLRVLSIRLGGSSRKIPSVESVRPSALPTTVAWMTIPLRRLALRGLPHMNINGPRPPAIPGVPFVDYTGKMIARALSTDESICIVDPAIDDGQLHGVDATNFCMPMNPAVLGNLKTGTYKVLSMNHGGESLGYGIGLMTSISSATVGLSAAGALGNLQQILHTPRTIPSPGRFSRKLRAKTDINGTTFLDLCWIFLPEVDSNGQPVPDPQMYRVQHGLPCDDRAGNPSNTNLYQPKMFPVAKFYDAFIGQSAQPPTTKYDFGLATDFDSVFANNPFFRPGRHAFYGQRVGMPGSPWMGNSHLLQCMRKKAFSRTWIAII